jgi:hypothetical protein
MEKNNKNHNNKSESRRKRGQIASDDLKPYINYDYKQLVDMLSDKSPQ